MRVKKVLIFTEFADTARYLFRQLREAGIEGVAQIDSATKGKRDSIIRRFSPYYKGMTSEALEASGEEENHPEVRSSPVAVGRRLYVTL